MIAFSFGLNYFFNLIGQPWLGMGVVIAFFIAFPLILRKRYMGRTRGFGGSGFGGGGFFGLNQSGVSVKYVCLVCNHRYKGGSCPRCGSKMKRADF